MKTVKLGDGSTMRVLVPDTSPASREAARVFMLDHWREIAWPLGPSPISANTAQAYKTAAHLVPESVLPRVLAKGLFGDYPRIVTDPSWPEVARLYMAGMDTWDNGGTHWTGGVRAEPVVDMVIDEYHRLANGLDAAESTAPKFVKAAPPHYTFPIDPNHPEASFARSLSRSELDALSGTPSSLFVPLAVVGGLAYFLFRRK